MCRFIGEGPGDSDGFTTGFGARRLLTIILDDQDPASLKESRR
jgi:hypothetical protein